MRKLWTAFQEWRKRARSGAPHYRTVRPKCQGYANAAAVAARLDTTLERSGVLVFFLESGDAHQVLWVLERVSAQERRLRIYDPMHNKYISNVRNEGTPAIAYEGPAMAWNAHPDSVEKRADDIFAKIIAGQYEWRVGVRDG